MDATDGLRRGVDAYGTGAPACRWVNARRIFNVLGHTIDNAGPVDST
jgi:F0F1-type ATP synthase beta subunit